MDAQKTACQSRFGQRSCQRGTDQQNFVDLSLPILFRPPRQISACREPRLAIVNAKIDCIGMWDLDRDEWHLAAAAPCGYHRRNLAVYLKLNRQIDVLRQQPFRVRQRNLRTVMAIQGHKVDTRSRRTFHQSSRDRPVKRTLRQSPRYSRSCTCGQAKYRPRADICGLRPSPQGRLPAAWPPGGIPSACSSRPSPQARTKAGFPGSEESLSPGKRGPPIQSDREQFLPVCVVQSGLESPLDDFIE